MQRLTLPEQHARTQQARARVLWGGQTDKSGHDMLLRPATREKKICSARAASAVTRGGIPTQSITDRLTVALIPKAGLDLGRLQGRTKLSKTDLVNRAITLYEFLDSQQAEGYDVLLRNRTTGETQIIQFL